MRLFIALKTTPYEDELFAIENKLKPFLNDVKWVDKENLHVTLKFLGEFKESLLYELNDLVREVTNNFHHFNFSISGISGFPDISSARVLFFSVKDNGNFIIKMMKEIDIITARFGLQREKSYVPHITFGRVRNGQVNLSEINFEKFNLAVSASGVVVIQSILMREGPVYKEIFKFEFSSK